MRCAVATRSPAPLAINAAAARWLVSASTVRLSGRRRRSTSLLIWYERSSDRLTECRNESAVVFTIGTRASPAIEVARFSSARVSCVSARTSYGTRSSAAGRRRLSTAQHSREGSHRKTRGTHSYSDGSANPCAMAMGNVMIGSTEPHSPHHSAHAMGFSAALRL